MSSDKPRVLVVEDNALIAMDVADLVERCGCVVVGPAGSLGEGLRLARESDLSGAILDVNLGTERVWPVAELLANRGVLFVFATGYERAEVPDRFSLSPILSKPLTQDSVGRCLRQLGVTRA